MFVSAPRWSERGLQKTAKARKIQKRESRCFSDANRKILPHHLPRGRGPERRGDVQQVPSLAGHGLFDDIFPSGGEEHCFSCRGGKERERKKEGEKTMPWGPSCFAVLSAPATHAWASEASAAGSYAPARGSRPPRRPLPPVRGRPWRFQKGVEKRKQKEVIASTEQAKERKNH